MKIKPNESYQLLGTSIRLKKGQTYFAEPATNQPNCKKLGLVFVNGILLAYTDYTIVQSK